MSGDRAALLAGIQLLRRDLAELTVRVIALEANQAVLPSRPATAARSPVTVNYTFPIASQSDPGPFASLSPDHLPLPEFSSPISEDPVLSERLRSSVASEVGRFFGRCLAGQRRGLSGRATIKLASVVYVLCRDCCYDPVHAGPSFVRLQFAPPCETARRLWRFTFAGFPSLWQARTAVRSAGLSWPTEDA